MKDLLYKFFVWSAGADFEALKNCPKTEQIKFAGYGGLVLIPAVLALFAMTYAISTIVQSPVLYVGAGLVFAGIVFIIDRFIVSTFRKSDSIIRDIFSIIFITRIIFATFIGLIVAHPLVMRIFETSILDEIEKSGINYMEDVRTVYAQKIDSINREIFNYEQMIRLKEAEIVKAEDEFRYEMNGENGKSSGYRGYGIIAKKLEDKQLRKINELNELKSSLEPKFVQSQKDIDLLKEKRDEIISSHETSTDYLARTMAMKNLSDRNKAVRTTKLFLILFFVFIDILPVTFKVISKKEAYEDLIEKKNQNALKKNVHDDDVYHEYLKGYTAARLEKIVKLISVEKEKDTFLGKIQEDLVKSNGFNKEYVRIEKPNSPTKLKQVNLFKRIFSKTLLKEKELTSNA